VGLVVGQVEKTKALMRETVRAWEGGADDIELLDGGST